jgi:hypothetical protein
LFHRSSLRRWQEGKGQRSRQSSTQRRKYDGLPGEDNENNRRMQSQALESWTQHIGSIPFGHDTEGFRFPCFNGHVVSTKSTKDTGNLVWDHYMTNYHDIPLGKFHNPMSPSAATSESSSTPMTMDTSSDSRDSWKSDMGMLSVTLGDIAATTTMEVSSSSFPNFSPVRPSKSRRLHL